MCFPLALAVGLERRLTLVKHLSEGAADFLARSQWRQLSGKRMTCPQNWQRQNRLSGV